MQEQGPHVAQMLPSGPGYGTQNAQMALISMIHHARSEVVITTPYFVPDEAFLQALQLACYRGVDVHLVLSQRIDQRFTQAAQEAYFGVLLDAGVQIHLYRPAFLHAKHVTIDDEVAMVGSTNMDIRSFALNAEAALVIYDREVVARMRGDPAALPGQQRAGGARRVAAAAAAYAHLAETPLPAGGFAVVGTRM
ncbi:phospholipase D-like domain-containing protein [Cupriavidus basilensis]